jgi:hypothetical protein
LIVRDEQSDFDEPGAGIAEAVDALARRELSLLVLAFDLLGPAP